MSTQLSDDIMLNIILRLPVKSLLRFRCVSKSWCNLISDSSFIKMHLNQAHASDSLNLFIEDGYHEDLVAKYYSLHSDGNSFESIKLEPPWTMGLPEYFKVLGSCDGLICLRGVFGCSCLKCNLYLWNPAIRKFKALPDLDGTCYKHHSHTVVGFGFLPKINDYKVVRLVYHGHGSSWQVNGNLRVDIYSLRMNTWKRVENVEPFLVDDDPLLMAFVSGSVHWEARVKTETNCYNSFIMSFDMVDEVFRKMDLPEACLHDCARHRCIRVFKETLALFVCVHDWDIWVMKEYGVATSWTKQFSIKRWVDFSCPFEILKNGEVMLHSYSLDLVSYDLKAHQVKDLHFIGMPNWLCAYVYVDSLILLNEGSEVVG